jgi:hypothetical protein
MGSFHLVKYLFAFCKVSLFSSIHPSTCFLAFLLDPTTIASTRIFKSSEELYTLTYLAALKNQEVNTENI